MSNFLKKLAGVESFQPEEDEVMDNSMDLHFSEIEDEDIVFDLPIDVYQDENNIFVRSFVPGLKPEQIDINITRDIVEISGERMQANKIDMENFHQRELVWGKFSKKVLLPHEVDVDKVKANIENGMITLKMPKLDKDRSVKVAL